MESKVKCLIVDDEPLAIEVLKSHIGKLDTLEVAGTANDAIRAFDFLTHNKVDLLFLDIHMPQMKGTELVKALRNPPAIIFTTAYREYALEGYDLNVLDYLLKPISFGRFMQAVEKFFAFRTSEPEIIVHEKEEKEGFLYLREKNLIHKVPHDEILYIESMGDNLTIHTINRQITCRLTLVSIEKLLPEEEFIRIHRSFIVSIKHITSFSPVSIFIDKKEFPIGSSYRDDAHKRLNYSIL